MAEAVHCFDGACPVSPASCATECLQKLDSAQQRALASFVINVILPSIALVYVARFHFYDREDALWAPPWRSHRLFAFRE